VRGPERQGRVVGVLQRDGDVHDVTALVGDDAGAADVGAALTGVADDDGGGLGFDAGLVVRRQHRVVVLVEVEVGRVELVVVLGLTREVSTDGGDRVLVGVEQFDLDGTVTRVRGDRALDDVLVRDVQVVDADFQTEVTDVISATSAVPSTLTLYWPTSRFCVPKTYT
ncbi:hypothetical protein, partial [Halogeometricum sp. CBA1124]|uniref:hypothetical protein n=1 Tax=Halogeometricum sp. CBA1124 TaxID=2668071 RepID=UPI0018D22883